MMRLSADCPVLDDKVLNASKLVRVVRDQRQAEAAGMRSNKKIVCPIIVPRVFRCVRIFA
jgi:hypothetical protein